MKGKNKIQIPIPLDYKIIKIDDFISIMILQGSLIYEEVEASGSLLEIEIPLNNIYEISFKEKPIVNENLGCNLFHFLDDYQTPYEVDNSVKVKHKSYITIKYLKEDKLKSLYIYSKDLNRKKFDELKINLSLDQNNTQQN